MIAAIFLSLASLCRLTGLFLFFPFVYEYLRTYGIRRFININLISFVIALFGISGFCVYQYIRFGEPLAFLKSQMEWGRRFSLNTEHFQLTTPASFANLSTDLLFFAVALIAGILLIKRSKASYGLYCLATVIMPVSTGTLMSINRYIMILFPVFILVASVKNKQFKFGWQMVSILLLAIYTALFVNNYWAG